LASSKQEYDKWHESMAAAEQGPDGARLQPWHETVLKLLPDLNGRDVLEIGCGRGDFAFELIRRYPLARIHGVDFSEKAIEIARQRCAKSEARIEFSVGDAQVLPHAAQSFDWIVSCECMEHVPSPEAMAREVYRLLRPEGRFVLTTENYFNGMVLGWLHCWIKGVPFNSGSGLQPTEHFFVFFKVRKILSKAGLTIRHMQSNHYQWLLLPGVDPAKLCTREVRSPILKWLFRPFGRHFTYAGERGGKL
jgi:ubiquinone/menaquinone biosynthesis C-methylase UbiE